MKMTASQPPEKKEISKEELHDLNTKLIGVLQELLLWPSFSANSLKKAREVLNKALKEYPR